MTTTGIRIAFCGTSGSGKSTMARVVANALGLDYTENSAGLLLNQDQQDMLVKKYGWTKSGHQDVIRLSNINPGFAWDFQWELLKTRARFIRETQSFVIDRSPVDNLTYFLLQTAHLVPEIDCDRFVTAAQEALQPITHLIFFPAVFDQIEINGSRISNWHYQSMVSGVFSNTIDSYFRNGFGLDFKFLVYGKRDFEARKKDVLEWIYRSV